MNDFSTINAVYGKAIARITHCIRVYGEGNVAYYDGDTPAAHRARIAGMIFLFYQMFEDDQATEDLQTAFYEAKKKRDEAAGIYGDTRKNMGIAP